MKDAAKGGIGLILIILFAVVLAWPRGFFDWVGLFLPKPGETIGLVVGLVSALATAAAAFWAARSANASRQSAKIGADTVEEMRRERRDQVLPIIVVKGLSIRKEGANEYFRSVTVKVKNCGRGPAIGCICRVSIGNVEFQDQTSHFVGFELGHLDVSEEAEAILSLSEPEEGYAAYQDIDMYGVVTSITYRSGSGPLLKSVVHMSWINSLGLAPGSFEMFEKRSGIWDRILEEDPSDLFESVG